MLTNDRRADYDVTNSVQVTSSDNVCLYVLEIIRSIYPSFDFSAVKQSFEDFDKLFEGDFKGYQACDTFYHDKQHSLDMTLALARLIEGYNQLNQNEPLKPGYAAIGIITALFHDAGYIRETNDDNINGSVYTRIHVSRSAGFLSNYLPMIGLSDYIDIAVNIVHYTGYELKPDQIQLPDPVLHTLGYMIGSADLIAQMSDRCYLEKCRDRLYPEFVLGDIAEIKKDDGSSEVIYASGDDLLEKTPEFYNIEINSRLNNVFKGVYQLAEKHFGNSNHYIDALESNISHLIQLIQKDRLASLKRIPLINNGTIYADNSDAEAIKKLNIK